VNFEMLLVILKRSRVEIVARNDWLMNKDYEYLIESSEAKIYLAMMRLSIKRMAQQVPNGIPSPQKLGLTGSARAF
jgi:hypothetical protein